MFDHDIIIRDGCLVDGTGAKGFISDIAVKNGKITQIGKKISGSAQRVINASGKIVSPGFIDIHTHCDKEIFKNADTRKALNYLFQGVTFVIGGNCGLSTMDVADFSKQINDSSIGINAGMLIGHNRVRNTVMGCVNRFADDFELEEMKKIVSNEMEKGAFGMSTGLIYIPGAYCETKEIVELCKVVQKYDGIYTTHLRNEADGIMVAIDEASEIGRESGIPVHISHLKVMGKSMWGKSVDALSKISGFQGQGLDITFDQYPYNATSTTIDAFSPAWALEGSLQDIQKKLEDPQTREKILEVVIWNMKNDRGGGDPGKVVVCSSPNKPEIEGKSLALLTKESGRTPTCENASQRVLDLIALGDVVCIFKCLGEEDVETVMKNNEGIVASDGFVMEFDQQKPHPRSYGTFPRVFSKYVREKEIISVENAVRKMTLNPAKRLGLNDRGTLTVGSCGDIVVFDPLEIQDVSTFERPHQYSKGVKYLMINGVLAVDDGEFTGEMAGKFISNCRR
jgi:N-acyl-D-amino-acid deacylase